MTFDQADSISIEKTAIAGPMEPKVHTAIGANAGLAMGAVRVLAVLAALGFPHQHPKR